MKGINNIIAVFLLVIIVISTMYIFGFYFPFRQEYLRITRDISSVRSQLDNIDKDLPANCKNKEDYIEELSIEIEKKVENLPKRLPSHEILELLSGLNDLNIKKKSIIFLNLSSNEHFTSIPVRIGFETSPEGLEEVFSYLDTLSVPLNISGFQFASKGGNLSKAGENARGVDVKGQVSYNLDVVLTVNFYIQSSREEEAIEVVGRKY